MKKMVSILLVAAFLCGLFSVSFSSFAAENRIAAGNAKVLGNTTVCAGQTVELILSLENCADATSAAVDLAYSDCFVLVDTAWLQEGGLSGFDQNTNQGALGALKSADISGALFKLTLEAVQEMEDAMVSVRVIARNGADTILDETVVQEIRFGIVGDLNGDGIVSDADAMYLLMHTFFPENYPVQQDCDFNEDGVVSDADATYLLMYTFFPDNYPIGPSKEDMVGIGVVNHDCSITLNGSELTIDTYTLKYEQDGVALADYAEICRLEIPRAGQNATYNGLINANCAPKEATAIGVYTSSQARVGAIELGPLKPADLGQKLYSFGALSDVHIQSETAKEDYAKALTYLNTVEKVQFINIAGDLTQSGTKAHLAVYKSYVDRYSPNTPVYEIAGNHEGAQADIADYIADYTGESMYYSYTYGNDVFIMVGNTAAANEIFTVEELNWLYQTLEANKDKRCFVFQHVFNDDTSGNALNLYTRDIWDGVDASVYDSLMEHYPNVTWFHGHSHLKFLLQEDQANANYDGSKGYHSVHVPSISVPRYKDEDNQRIECPKESEGYIIDVYENGIILRGRDFVNEKFLPIAQYCLNTKPKTVQAGKYCDKTGTVLNANTPVLKSGAAWYMSALDKSAITKITFSTENNVPEFDESWDVTLNTNGTVMAYRKGTELTVVGGQYGIALNANASGMFEGFSGVTEICGLENLYTSNLTEFTNVFKDCHALKAVDLSTFDLNNVRILNNLFQNCTSLVSAKLPNNINKNPVVKYNTVSLLGLFDGCSALQNMDLSFLPTDNLYIITYAFKECANLESVKFGDIKISVAGSVFYRCKKLTTVDMRGADFAECTSLIGMFRECSALEELLLPAEMDTRKVENMSGVFYNCKLLNLDCSDWRTDSCTTVTDFNTNASGVIAPTLEQIYKINDGLLGLI